MNEIIPFVSGIASITNQFYQPVKRNVIEGLLIDHRTKSHYLQRFNDVIIGSMGAVASKYYLEEVKSKTRGADADFCTLEQAKQHLDVDYWKQAVNVTGIYDTLPQNRRDEWDEQLRHLDIPAFDQDHVIETLKDLMSNRDLFLAERVDGLFTSLSDEHLTNQPSGFYKRMILYVAKPTVNRHNNHRLEFYDKVVGHINDLRKVIAKFMGRGCCDKLDHLKRQFACSPYGEWQEIDGGSLRFKLFKKGTAHLDVHPDIAWRLNEILAFLYPLAIPSDFRKPAKKDTPEFNLSQELIPFDVLATMQDEIQACREDATTSEGVYSINVAYNTDKHLLEKVDRILCQCGGVKQSSKTYSSIYHFTYDFMKILPSIILSGCIPEQKSHQFYETPDELAQLLVEWCEIDDDMKCLEPQAGRGGIAQFMPKSTTCVEVSDLHCKILKSKGFNSVFHTDFLKWAETAPLFDRICANPPFSMKRAKFHLEAACRLLVEKGVLTAIVPTAVASRFNQKGFEVEIIAIASDYFAGVSIDLARIKIRRVQYA
ncbi:MAG: DUF4942 domain-containing protein [Endozoicomonadaceae bacterium]|nr:DUF4942 domain-containing protein [Endozoicomonadaceae bacterium]